MRIIRFIRNRRHARRMQRLLLSYSPRIYNPETGCFQERGF